METSNTPESTAPEKRNDSNHYVNLKASHLALGGGVVAALTLLQPVKDFFYTREEGVAAQRAFEVAQGANLARFVSIEAKVDGLGKSLDENAKTTRELIDSKNEKLRTELREEIRTSQAQIIARIEETTNRIINSMDRRDSVLNEKIRDLKPTNPRGSK